MLIWEQKAGSVRKCQTLCPDTYVQTVGVGALHKRMASWNSWINISTDKFNSAETWLVSLERGKEALKTEELWKSQALTHSLLPRQGQSPRDDEVCVKRRPLLRDARNKFSEISSAYTAQKLNYLHVSFLPPFLEKLCRMALFSCVLCRALLAVFVQSNDLVLGRDTKRIRGASFHSA